MDAKMSTMYQQAATALDDSDLAHWAEQWEAVEEMEAHRAERRALAARRASSERYCAEHAGEPLTYRIPERII